MAQSNARLGRTRRSAAFIGSCVGEPLKRNVRLLLVQAESPMKRMTVITLIGMLILFTVTISFPQGKKATPTPQQNEKDGAEDDKVYTAKEVDVKAKVKNRLDNPPEYKSDCPRGGGRVSLRVI